MKKQINIIYEKISDIRKIMNETIMTNLKNNISKQNQFEKQNQSKKSNQMKKQNQSKKQN